MTVSLPYERGRLAFKTVSGVHQELLAMGAEELELAPLDDHYADESRPALHHIERRLFEDAAERARRRPADAVSFHSAGGERAEVELAAARVLQLLRDGVTPGDVAVVFRDPTATRRCSSRSSAPTGSPTRSTARCRSGTPASGAGCSR